MTVGLNKPRGGGGGGRGGSRGGRGGARGGRGSSPGGRGRGGDTRGGGGRGGGSRGRGGGDARKDYNSSAGKKQNPLKRAIGESGTKKFRQGGGHGNDGGRDGNTKTQRRPTGTPSARTKEIDIHLASKIAHDFTKDINIIKDKLQGFTFDSLDDAFRFVPPTYVMQHLPTDVTKFRTYFSKFNKGSKNDVIAFVKWFEWASYEAGKTLSGIHHQAQKHKPKEDAEVDAAGDDDGDAVEGGDATTGSKRKVSHSRATLAQLAKEREHMRALLQMCLRHNCTKRREGQRALINHLNSHLNEQSQSKSFAALKEDAHHSVSYAVSRLILGMVTENFANVALYCQTLHMVLQQTPLHPRVIISLLGDSLSLDARMKAQEVRTQMAASGDAVLPTAADDLDPDDISDPTKGERNQRIAAAVFAMAAVLTSRGQAVLAPADTQQVAQYLSYCYIENKGIRVLSGNLLLMLLGKQKQGADGSTGSPLALLSHAETWKWVQFAFFRFPKLEYYRPEAVQLMIQIMQMDAKPTTIVSGSSSILLELSQHDPLEPSVLEQFANALFRRDQVTAVHPMVHPVWYDLLELIKTRCAQGESLKQHLSTFVHTVIAPYRRGASESPRNTLFLKIVDMVGSLALQHEDADDRMEVVRIATKSVGFGKLTTTKATPIAELRTLSIETMSDKLNSLVKQLGAITDNEPASVATRTWTLKELRSCLLVPYREGTDLPALNQAMMALLQLGFFPRRRTSDEVNLNRAVYLFADVFSFTYTKPGGMSRVKASVSPNTIIAAYLEAEDAKKTRFSTAVNHVKFRKARNRIVEALENDNVARSVLFYDPKDMRILLTLLFLMLSVDDHTNEAAVNIASNIIPDLARFYKTGTIESIDVLYDVMMALVLRPTAPMHVLPLMASIRRIATGYLYRYARFITDRRSLDIVLAPLVEGYQTNEREAARNRLAGDSDDEAREDGEDDDASASSESVTSNSDDEASDEEGDASDVDKEEEEVAVDEEDDDEEDGDDDDQDNEESDDASTVADSEAADDDAEASAESVESSDDDDDDDGDDTDASNASGEDEENANDDDGWNTEEGEFVEEEKPTQHYLNSLQQLAGNIDLGFAYPTDTENKQKSDVVRSINIATRVGLGMRSPLVVHVFQVLLAVLRSEVKSDDPVIFDAAKANITMLMMSRQRYFGRFLEATELLQLLGDIQTYCRKLVRYVIPKDKAGTRQAAMMRKRLLQLKMMALSVFHYTCYLAHKNHADESVRITYMEFYQSLFYDRGWEKSGLSQLKRDLYHYRHGFAWALLPTAVQKFEAMKYVEGAQRVLAFNGACAMVESMLSRVSGLPQALKASASANIRSFITSPTLVELFEMKQTSLYTFFHVVKMALEYNSKIQLDTDHITALVKEIVDNDNLQVTKATVRVIASIERLLNLTPMIRETKAPVPVQVLYKQFETKWRKDKSEFHRKAKIAKKKTAESLLAHRNDDPTDEERAKKRRRREELKVVDREERETLRAMRNRDLTKEEKDARRKRMGVAKQERIAKNKDRKRQLHEKRTASFVRWREEKLSSA